MLPTTGFFKNIDCPYYETSCDRPYCHFKHRKKSQESGEKAAASAPSETPTYNPTPKSQLASARSHIPISYVPDLAIRSKRNNFRSLSTYGYDGKQPTYNPTPLSILSTSKVTVENKQPKDLYNIAASQETHNKINEYVPTSVHEETNDINFEDLETEFHMIDEIISDSGAANGGEKFHKNVEIKSSSESKSKPHSHSKSSSSSSKSKRDSKSKSDSKSKASSHSTSKKNAVKSESKHKRDEKVSKPSKEDEKKSTKSSERKKDSKSSTTKKKPQESKEKYSSKHKENEKEKDKDRHKHSKKSKERDKERKSTDKKKHKDKEREVSAEITKIKLNINDNISDDCDILNEFIDDQNDVDDYDSDLEEDPLEECYKIFTEYKPTEPDIFPEKELNLPEESLTLQSKKRIAHENADRTKAKVLFNKPKATTSAAQIMVNRLKAARLSQANNEQNNIINEMNRQTLLKRPSETLTNDNKKFPKLSSSNNIVKTATKDNKNNVKPTTLSTTLVDDIIQGKPVIAKPRRIAPVQNVNSIQRAKAKIEEMAKMRALNAITKTSSQSIIKGAKRVAHVPEYSVADLPDVLEAERSKLPVNVRTRYLTMIIDECMKLYLSRDEAQHRALNEEFKCYERCAALVTYRNSSMLAINRLRKELQEREMSGLGPILPGETANTGKDEACDLRGRKFHTNIKRYILTDEELVLHGFPRESETPGHAAIKFQKKISKGYLEEDDRVCCRCSKLYKVDDEGFPVYVEECVYHPLKKRTFRGESIYLCCRTGEGTGCATSTTHVSENINVHEAEVEGYQTTMPPEYEDDPRSYEVFALDCEMCYTTKGLELTRVTIVNSECKTVYESLVKPLNSIIDYNTRFSGITEEQMNRTATSILQVQANILHLCNSNTILIGHSLESDMKALKIIHSTIIDTSVLFPHKFGLPHKRALRDLAREFLKKIIQNDISGHDSAEDALTCMELVQWKLKEEFKARGIKT